MSNRHAHDAIHRWLSTAAPQDQEISARDLYQLAVNAGLDVGYSTLLGHLQRCLPDETVSSPRRGVYVIHLKAGVRPLLPMPEQHKPGEVTLYTLHLQLVQLNQRLDHLTSGGAK